jgi:hypothetical protein
MLFGGIVGEQQCDGYMLARCRVRSRYLSPAEVARPTCWGSPGKVQHVPLLLLLLLLLLLSTPRKGKRKKVKKRLYMEEDIYIYISIWKCSSISYVSLYKRASRLYTAQPFSSSYMRDATARLGVFYSTTQTFLLLLLSPWEHRPQPLCISYHKIYIFIFFFEKERNSRSSSSDFYTSQKKTKNWKCAVVFHKTKKNTEIPQIK